MRQTQVARMHARPRRRRAGDAPSTMVRVTARMTHMPAPGALNDGVDLLKLRLPPEFPLNFLRRGDEPRRVPWPAWPFDDVQLFAGDFFTASDHFAHARAAARAQIVLGAVFCGEREDMCLREIEDMYVVANAGPIRRI